MRRQSKILKSFVLKKWKGADPCILINGKGCWASCHSNCPEFWVITWEPRRYSQWVRISHGVCRQEWNGRNCFGRAPISAPMGRVGLLPHVQLEFLSSFSSLTGMTDCGFPWKCCLLPWPTCIWRDAQLAAKNLSTECGFRPHRLVF